MPYNLRSLNKDSYVIETDGHSGALLVAVFDGHGPDGHKISQYLKSTLPTSIFLDPAFPSDIHAAILRQVDVVETIIIADRNIGTEFSGSTMSLCIILNDIIYVANVGNSRAVIGERDKSGKISAIQLTQDHVPGVEKESERIMSRGGRIFPVEYGFGPSGRQRIWLGHMDVPGLTISRSIGDTVGTSVGVVSSPIVHHTVLMQVRNF